MEFVVPEFLQKQDADDIHKRMLDNLPGDIDKTEGGFAWDYTRPTALEKSEYVQMNLLEAIKCIFPEFAYGEWLDYHAKNKGMERKPEKEAYGKIEVTAKPGKTIPAGSIFSTESKDGIPSIDFKTLADAFIIDEKAVEIAVMAINPGIEGNVSANSIKYCSSQIDDIFTIDNAEATSGGTEAEDDESLRARIEEYNKAQGLSFVGSVSDYKRWATELPGVGQAIVIPANDDTGLVTIVLIDSNGEPANEQLCRQVYDHIMSPDNENSRFAPVNAHLSVIPPQTLEIAVSATIELSGVTVEQAKHEFINTLKQYLVIAADEKEIKYSKVSAALANVNGINDYKDVLLNGDTKNIKLGVADLATISSEHVSFTIGVVDGQ